MLGFCDLGSSMRSRASSRSTCSIIALAPCYTSILLALFSRLVVLFPLFPTKGYRVCGLLSCCSGRCWPRWRCRFVEAEKVEPLPHPCCLCTQHLGRNVWVVEAPNAAVQVAATVTVVGFALIEICPHSRQIVKRLSLSDLLREFGSA